MDEFKSVVIDKEVPLTALNINFGLRVRRLSGKREGKVGVVCKVNRYTPGFTVQYGDGKRTRCVYYRNFIILAGQQVRIRTDPNKEGL